LELIQPKISAFEEQVSQIREDLAAVYEEENEYTEAAKTLAAIPLESGQRVNLTPDYKAKINIHISQLYLEDEDADWASAELYLNKGIENC